MQIGPHRSWIDDLSEEDVEFLKRFLLSSGSLKDVAKRYGISYPTVRNRLNRLIDKVEVADDPSLIDEFQREVKLLVADDKLHPDVARKLSELHATMLKIQKGPDYEGWA